MAGSTRFPTASCLLLGLTAPLVAGHAYLSEPPSRNMIAFARQDEYCPHCLQSGGPNLVKSRGDGVWPTRKASHSHGLCGDPVQGQPPPANWRDEKHLDPDPVQRTYIAGDVVEFHIGVSTHHKGHYEFRICDKAVSGQTFGTREEGQACLDKWVLERAPPRDDCQPNDPDADCQILDPDQPHRWFLPPRAANTQEAGPNWDDRQASPHPSETEVHRMRYKIPRGLNCTQCTLQWYWSTGNTCLYDGGYFSYFRKMAAAGWSTSSWCPFCQTSRGCAGTCCGAPSGKFAEEFWNCADIQVLAANGQPPAPQPSPPGRVPSPPRAPAPGLAPAPPGPETSCAGPWEQCGGGSHGGSTCCVPGHYCKKIDVLWYHQCVPGNRPAAPAPPLPEPEAEPEAEQEEEEEEAEPEPAENCAGPWEQCGGGSHSGPTCCVPGHYCKKIDVLWYHQCVPGRRLAAPAPPLPTPTAAAIAASPLTSPVAAAGPAAPDLLV